MRPDERVVAAWNEASRILGVDVISPFSLPGSAGTHHCTAFIPHFGGRRGIVILETVAPSFDTDNAAAEAADRLGYKWSFINRDRYSSFDRETFVSTLIEWGFFGPPDRRPAWWQGGPTSFD